MRRRIVLAAAALGAAASLLPATPASAVCITAYYVVTGRCSPCDDANAVMIRVEDRTGVPTPRFVCVA